MNSSHSFRLKVAGWHLLASAVGCASAAAIVFALWYPSPYAAIAGGTTLFVILLSVDLVIGPLLTLVVASSAKPRRSLARDIALIAAVQLAAFGYGMYSMALARPVALAFEIDRFRLISAADVDTDSLERARPEFRQLSWTGPRLVSSDKPTEPAAAERALQLGLGGIDLSMQPTAWSDYAVGAQRAWSVARPVAILLRKYPERAAQLEAMASHAGASASELRYLPLLTRRASWIAILSTQDNGPVGFLPLDGFF